MSRWTRVFTRASSSHSVRLLVFLLTLISFVILFTVNVGSKQTPQTIKLREGRAVDFDVTDSGVIVVGNIKLGMVDVYSLEGRFERAIRPPVDISDYFSPGSITAEGKNLFWVVDTYSGRTMRCLTDGNFVASFLLEVSGIRLRNAAAIAVLAGETQPTTGIGNSENQNNNPETNNPSGTGKPSGAAANLPEEDIAEKEGRLYVQRPDGVISAFNLNGGWIYDLPAPSVESIQTPAGIVLDYPLLWSLDYESRKIYIYDLERRKNPPGTVSVEGIPEDAPICGLSSVVSESLYVTTGGTKPVWKETDDGWKSIVERKMNGSQPPVARTRNSKLYILDRDANTIEIYKLDEV